MAYHFDIILISFIKPRTRFPQTAVLLSSSKMLRNLCLIGPPGSGKGSYGKLLAKSLDIPLVTVSSLLKRANFDLSSGKLMGDRVVSEILVEHLQSLPTGGFLLDGYPRTIRQVQWMAQKWPIGLRVDVAISLEVPKEVCLPKLLGRRACANCGGNWNVAHVQHGDYNLPPSLPDSCTNCRGEEDWITRSDDVEGIVDERLRTFYTTTAPILDHYEGQGKLLRFSPFLGYDDMPRFKATLSQWLHSFEN